MGEAIVAVVAHSAVELADAMETVMVEYRDLDVVIDAAEAVASGSPAVYDSWPDNIAGTFEVAIGDVDSAISTADVVVSRRFRIGRQTAASLEPRGVLGEWDGRSKELVLWTSTQSPHIVRDFIAQITGVPMHRVTIRVPAVGGGFGAKFHFYPEESAVALIAMKLGRPVVWLEGRTESFVATVHARDLVVDATIAARTDGAIVAMSADIVADMGAYTHMVSYGPAWLTSVMMTNVYAIPNAVARLKAVITKKTPSGSYRGWGAIGSELRRRTHGRTARDRVDTRQCRTPTQELHRTRAVPLHEPLSHLRQRRIRTSASIAVSNSVATTIGGIARRRPAPLGRHIGIGVSFYVENTGLGPSRQMNEGGLNQGGYAISHIRMEPGGEVTLFTGLCEMGQGFTNGLVAAVRRDRRTAPGPGHGRNG